MLRIRSEQIEALRRDVRRRFVGRVASELRAGFPAQLRQTPAAALADFVDRGIDEAARYGITDETDVHCYLSLRVESGADFAESQAAQWARDILDDDTLDARDKLAALSRALIYRGPGHHG